MTRLIVARHGNTFEAGETPRRVGARTDMDLTAKGVQQAKTLGVHLKTNNLLPNIIFTSHLKRTIQSAHEIMVAANLPLTPQPNDIFNEIDYGPDENRTEDEVIARLGATAIKNWEDHATLPPGWSPDANTIIQNWQNFAANLSHDTVLVVTSNGIARFALNLATDIPPGCGLKLATGAYGILEHTPQTGWVVRGWNIRP